MEGRGLTFGNPTVEMWKSLELENGDTCVWKFTNVSEFMLGMLYMFGLSVVRREATDRRKHVDSYKVAVHCKH